MDEADGGERRDDEDKCEPLAEPPQLFFIPFANSHTTKAPASKTQSAALNSI